MQHKYPFVYFLAALSLLVSSCDNNANPIGNASPIAGRTGANTTASLIIEPNTVALEVGKNAKLTAILNQSGEFKRDLPAEWVSLNQDVASVDALGNITALKPGNATIQATILGQQAKTLITISPSTGTSSAEKVPGTSGSSAATPTVKELSTVSKDGIVSPELAKLRTIEIKPTNQVVPPVTIRLSSLNEQRQFQAVGKDSEGQEIPNLTFTWSSSNEKVATVNSTGVVTAIATGVTNLLATAGNVQSNTIVIEVQSGIVNTHIKFTE